MFRLSNLWLVLAAFILAACNAPSAPTRETVVNTPTARPPATSAPVEAQPTLAPTATPTAEPPQVEPTTPPQTAPVKWIAYIGADGNVWLLNPLGGQMEPITQDGTPWGVGSDPDAEIVQYNPPQWSADGQLLAFERSHGTPVEWGFQFESSLVVYDVAARQTRVVLQGLQLAGFAWRPGTRQIAYAQSSRPDYFTARGKVASALAMGIWMVDTGSGEVSELVKPERGYHLVAPQFSPDGQVVSFDELLYMEGRGAFAYYDLAVRRYVSWEKPIGSYQWSRDGQVIFYDYLTYIPSGSERIYAGARDHSAERLVSAGDMPAEEIAYGPALSPAGDQLAYLVERMGLEQAVARLYLQSVDGGAPRDFGLFDQPGSLSWSPDGQSLTLESGPYEARQVVLVSLVDGSTRVLAQGLFPAWQP